MILEKGDMFSVWGKTDLFLFTSNPIVTKDGLAVMGRGIAKQLSDRFPDIRRHFGLRLLSDRLDAAADATRPPSTGILGRYRVQFAGAPDRSSLQTVGYFMVKDHWKFPAKLSIIEDSVNDLLRYAGEFGRIDLNFPGIGNGKLKREDVLPLILQLPDNVHIWEYDEVAAHTEAS